MVLLTLWSDGTACSTRWRDPPCLFSIRTLKLGTGCRGIAVNQRGVIFGVTWGGLIICFDGEGGIQNQLNAAAGNLSDIDISPTGQIAVGSRSGTVILTDESLSAKNKFSTAGGNFVAFGTLK